MSEYVFRDAEGFGCCMDDEMDELPGVTAREYFAEENTDHYGTIHEEIVRCRDCKHCMAYMAGAYCDHMAHSVEPDGFCSWGEKKEGGE